MMCELSVCRVEDSLRCPSKLRRVRNSFVVPSKGSFLYIGYKIGELSVAKWGKFF